VSPAPASTTPGADPVADTRERVQRIALERIRPSPLQPRKQFDTESLQELADSIKEQGVVQPLIVRGRGDYFELIAGERRWRAAQLAGLRDVPVLVREADDPAVLELALIENLQRENLNPLEEAQGYTQLIDRFHLRQEDVALKVSKSRAVVANALRLLRLPAEVQGYVRDGRLSVGHAKVILGLNDAAEQTLAAERVIKQALNVRQTEALVASFQKSTAPKVAGVKGPAHREANIMELENRLREKLATKVQLRYSQGKGAVEIRFFSDDELERLLQLLGVQID
jgi:ParB family chromosome partitioning protein